MSNYKIIINHYSDGISGHVDVTLIDTTGVVISGIVFQGNDTLVENGTQVTLGQNLSATKFSISDLLTGGLKVENSKLDNYINNNSTDTPINALWRSEEIFVTKEQFEQILDFSNQRLYLDSLDLGTYNVLGHNCSNYADAILKLAGGDGGIWGQYTIS